MTTINDVGDLARVLREHPEWRDTIRGLLLGEEIARLPEKLAAFIEATQQNFQLVYGRLDSLDEGQRQAEERFNRLDEGQRQAEERFNRIDERFDRLETSVNRLTGRVDNGLGAFYEHRAEKAARSLADRHLDLSRVKILQGAQAGVDNQFAELLDNARRTGLITQDQFQELLQLDLVFAATRNSDGADIHVAAEVSITAGDSDIDRAARRAAILAVITGQRVFPAVISANVDSARRARAEQQAVTVMVLPEN